MTTHQTEISLYHLTTHPLEKVLPRLLEKIYEGKMRALVVTDSEERKEFLNAVLWTYSPNSFLPHSMDGAGEPDENPIWVSVDTANKNRANVLVLTGNTSTSDISPYQRCVDIFDGNDANAFSAALIRRENYNKSGQPVVYWKQAMDGSWERE